MSSAADYKISKFYPRFEGPYTVTEVRENTLKITNEQTIIRTNIDQVKIYFDRRESKILQPYLNCSFTFFDPSQIVTGDLNIPQTSSHRPVLPAVPIVQEPDSEATHRQPTHSSVQVEEVLNEDLPISSRPAIMPPPPPVDATNDSSETSVKEIVPSTTVPPETSSPLSATPPPPPPPTDTKKYPLRSQAKKTVPPPRPAQKRPAVQELYSPPHRRRLQQRASVPKKPVAEPRLPPRERRPKRQVPDPQLPTPSKRRLQALRRGPIQGRFPVDSYPTIAQFFYMRMSA